MQESPPTFAEAWRAGVASMWPMIGLSLIFLAFVIAIILGVAMTGGLALATAIALGLFGGQGGGQWLESWEASAGMVAAVGGLLGLLFVAVLAGLVLSLVIQLAQRATVLADRAVGPRQLIQIGAGTVPGHLNDTDRGGGDYGHLGGAAGAGACIGLRWYANERNLYSDGCAAGAVCLDR